MRRINRNFRTQKLHIEMFNGLQQLFCLTLLFSVIDFHLFFLTLRTDIGSFYETFFWGFFFSFFANSKGRAATLGHLCLLKKPVPSPHCSQFIPISSRSSFPLHCGVVLGNPSTLQLNQSLYACLHF